MGQLLGNLTVGSIVNIQENGGYVPFYVSKHNYEPDLNGEGRTLLVREKCYDDRVWNDPQLNKYIDSDIDRWVRTNYKNLLDSKITEFIGKTKFYYTPGGGNYSVSTFSRGVFLLSLTELGLSEDNANIEGEPLPIADQLKIAYLQERPTIQWTRSPRYSRTANYDVFVSDTSGQCKWVSSAATRSVRPVFTLPGNIGVDDSNNIVPFTISNISNVTAPDLAMASQPIPLSWSLVSFPGYEVTYQLQRSVNGGMWENVGEPVSQPFYNDTAQIGWLQVQYQVAAVIENVIGNYTQSSIIPVSNPSALVISGSDGNLGTLTSNVPYTVSSNTGNPISLTRTVNDAQVVTLTVESGFAYNIPIADLPTGTGTIQITASVKNGSEIVTQTRTWTYYKTPINIPSTGGIAQLTQNGQNIWPVTVPDAVEAPVYLGGNLNAALNKLGQAALYTKIGSPKYNQVTVDLSKVKVGDEVLLPYNDVMVPHIVVQIGNPDASMYDSSCDGVWLLRKASMNLGKWNNTNINTFANSTIISAMQNYITNYDNEVQSAIKTVKIPYCVGGGNATVNSGANGYECQLFPLSCRELGITTSGEDSLPIDGAKLDYFISGTSSSAKKLRIPFDESYKWYWTRSIISSFSNSVEFIDGDGDNLTGSANEDQYYRPAFIMPTTFNHTYYVGNNNSVYPSQEYTQGGSITDVFGYDVPICQYETGSYVGTGTYGSSNPNSLNFSFKPKFIVVNGVTGSGSSYNPDLYPLFLISGVEKSLAFVKQTSMTDVIVTFSGNSVSWYTTYSTGGATIQKNSSNITYNYIAIG